MLVIFTYDLPKCTKYAIPSIFADDTKCLRTIRFNEDTRKLQIMSLTEAPHQTYTTLQQIKIYSPLLLSSNYIQQIIQPIPSMEIHAIKSSLQHKDLGVTFSSDY